jgi:hypothetical protein
MPQLYCTFCQHRWQQAPLEFWICPDCTMGAAPEQVVEATNEEIVAIWEFLSSYKLGASLEKLAPAGHKGYFASYAESELDAFLDLLVLVFDTTILPEAWKDIGGGQPATERLLTYYDAGALLPLDQQGDLAQCVAMHTRHKSDRPKLGPLSSRVAREGRLLDVAIDPTDGSYDGTFVLIRENLMKILSRIDSRTPGFSFSEISVDLIKQQLLPRDADPTYLGMHLMNHLNGQIITSQLLGVPLVFGTVTDHVLKYKLQSRNSGAALDETHLLKKFTESLRIVLPDHVSPNQILKLREGDACVELRKILSKCVAKAQGADDLVALDNLSCEYNAALHELNEHARSFGDSSVAVLAGAFSTLGSVLGGPVGAVVGGIGGTAVSLAARPAIESIYKATQENWAFYLYKWAGRRNSDN